jgi:hypothetical protein
VTESWKIELEKGMKKLAAELKTAKLASHQEEETSVLFLPWCFEKSLCL